MLSSLTLRIRSARMMLTRATLALAIVSMIAGAVQAQSPEIEVRKLANGESLLIHRLTLDAPVDTVWRMFTTAEGMRSWAAPTSFLELKVGAVWESSYDPNAKRGDPGNIRTKILSYVPGRMLSLQAIGAPPGFPHPEVIGELFSVVEFEPVGTDRTTITMYGIGYRDTPAHNAVMTMFRDANAWTLQQLVRRLENGPVDWKAMMQSANQ